MERTLNETTPQYVHDAVAALMDAETRKGPYRFLDDVSGCLPLIPERGEIDFDRARFHPLDDAIELARFFAVEVEEHAHARRWKAASGALRTVDDCQRTYWVRRHVETLRPRPGFIIRGDVTQRVPRIHVYLAKGDVHLIRLPPTSSQEAVEAAIDAWIAGCRHGAERSARLVRRTAAYIEDAIQ